MPGDELCPEGRVIESEYLGNSKPGIRFLCSRRITLQDFREEGGQLN